ncbi:MAG TPA: DUF2752 domain-containing protein [Anaeromyxobacteraceae bacterium]|nr:DUF2752 domain-containing protein [Anaeromyxobacteraceae bacterium]
MALSWRRTGRFGVAELFALLGLASFLAARFLPVLELGLVCPFRAATGLPCASCGMTHAFVHLARGEVVAALAASPLGAVLAAGAWALSLADLARAALGLPVPVLPERSLVAAARLAVFAVAVNWAWLLWRGAA